jgi:TetR/AcrR family fatty acid metabolism transcriptional regulator
MAFCGNIWVTAHPYLYWELAIMPRPKETDRQQHLQDTRQKLLDAAAAEFAEKGYVGANINSISLAAGLAKGTVYNYFDSKCALMRELIEEIAAKHYRHILEQVATAATASLRLARFFQGGFEFVEKYPGRAQVVTSLIYGPDQEFKQCVYQAYEPLFALIIDEILQPGTTQGEFRDLDVDSTAALVMSIYLGSTSQLGPDGKIWLDPQKITHFILEGISGAGKPSEDRP